MATEEQRKNVCDAWLHAAAALSFSIEAPYLLKSADGQAVLCSAYLPDFGGPAGMVFGLLEGPDHEVDKRLSSAADAQGLYHSFINAEVYESCDEEVFKEALTDWGFFGDEERRPVWLRRK